MSICSCWCEQQQVCPGSDCSGLGPRPQICTSSQRNSKATAYSAGRRTQQFYAACQTFNTKIHDCVLGNRISVEGEDKNPYHLQICSLSPPKHKRSPAPPQRTRMSSKLAGTAASFPQIRRWGRDSFIDHDLEIAAARLRSRAGHASCVRPVLTSTSLPPVALSCRGRCSESFVCGRPALRCG